MAGCASSERLGSNKTTSSRKRWPRLSNTWPSLYGAGYPRRPCWRQKQPQSFSTTGGLSHVPCHPYREAGGTGAGAAVHTSPPRGATPRTCLTSLLLLFFLFLQTKTFLPRRSVAHDPLDPPLLKGAR